MKQKLSDYIADFVTEKGVTHCFTVTGGGAMHLNDSFGHKDGLTCVYNHHEQGSAIAAEGYARMTGKVPLVCVTSGPGGTNALTGVLGSWLDSIPMLVISGQVKRTTTVWWSELPLRQVGDQEYHIADAAKLMTKYAIMVTEPEKIAWHLEKALFLATNGRCGPVWLDIPLDIQASIIDTETLEHFDTRWHDMTENPRYDNNLSAKVAMLIEGAKRPVIMAGEGIRMSGSRDVFLALANKWKIPVVTAWNAHDILPDASPYFCGRPGTVGTRGGNFVVQNSDLLITLGCRLNVRQIGYAWETFAKNSYKVMIDIDLAELFKHTLKINLPIHANLKDALPSLLAEPYEAGDRHSQWLKQAYAVNKKYPAIKMGNPGTPMNPYAFIPLFWSKLRDDEKVVTGNGSACVVTFQTAKIKEGQRLFTNSGCAAMGYGLPAALGAAVGTGGRIVCIDGDGSFMMNIQELHTIAHNKLDVKIILMNNGGYHSIRQTQANLFGSRPMVGVGSESGDLGFPDFSLIAAASGIPYFKVENLEAAGVIDDFLAVEGPAFCESIIDPAQFFEPKLSSKVMPDGTITSPDIDDMFPFLPREEYIENTFGKDGRQ